MSARRGAGAAAAHFDSGAFQRDLARRVAIRSESQDPAQAASLRAYVEQEMSDSLAALGFDCRVFDNPLAWHRLRALPDRAAGTKTTPCPRC